jgi:hypothetical protein
MQNTVLMTIKADGTYNYSWVLKELKAKVE